MFSLLLSFFFTACDAPEAWQMSFQDPATPAVEGMIFFHNYIMIFLIVIGLVVMWMLYKVIALFNENSNLIASKFTHSSLLEIVWTILPAFILLLIAIPSFTLFLCYCYSSFFLFFFLSFSLTFFISFLLSISIC